MNEDDREETGAESPAVELVALSDDEFKDELARVIPHLRAFGRSLSGNRDLADDLVQETLLSMHRKLASCDPGRPFLPWLAAIARYRWVDQLRKEYRAAEVSIDDSVPDASAEASLQATLSLERLLAHLPAPQAMVIELVKIEGLSVVDAAQRSGQSVSLVKINIHRGIRKLAALIEKE